jgi:hypothetical protein
VLTALLVCGSAAAFENLAVTATLDVDSSRVTGVMYADRVELPAGDSILHLRLYANLACGGSGDSASSTACGISIDSLMVEGHEYSHLMEYHPAGLSVVLRREDRRETVRLRVVFRVGIPFGGLRLGRDSDRFRLECWLPVPAPRSARGWLIEDYAGGLGEPVGDLFNYRAEITYPDTLQLIAPGVVSKSSMGGTTVAAIEMDSSCDIPLYFSSGYREDSSRVAGTSRRIYYRSEDAFAVDSIAGWVDYTLEYMSREVMQYPFEEFVVVVGAFDFSGALELPRMIWIPSFSGGVVTGWPRVTVIHEVIHQWFYGIVASNQASHPWLDESVTQYFAMRINEAIGGERGDLVDYFGVQGDYRTVLRMQSKAVFDYARIDLASSAYKRDTYFGSVYWKGSQVMATLTGLMGEEGERSFWREYAGAHAYARPTPEDFFRMAERYMPSADTGLAERVIGVMVEPDYAILEIAVEPAAQVLADSGLSPAPLLRSRVEYAVHHPLRSQVRMQLVMDDGSMVDTVVSSQPGRHEVIIERGDQYVQRAVIDPDTAIVIDRDLTNNSLSISRENFGGLRLWSGLTFLVESLFSYVWGW